MKKITSLAVSLTVFIGTLSSTPASWAEDDRRAIAGFGEKSLQVAVVWTRDSTTGQIVRAPVGYVDEDPNQYMYDVQCRNEVDSRDVRCLSGQLECPASEVGGVPGVGVVWKVAPKALVSPEWSQWKPVGGGPVCLFDEKPEDVLPAIAARVVEDFQKLPVSPAVLTVQPGPHTLRGAETNIFAAATEQVFDVSILGQGVQLVASPVEYTYSYGDGSTFGPTMFAGAPLPPERWGEQTRTSYVYKATGDFPVSVTTSFRGTYSVNGGPALPIAGTGQFASPTQLISVWRSESRHVADDCIQNPQSWACPGTRPTTVPGK